MTRLVVSCLLASVAVVRADVPPDHRDGFRRSMASSVEVGPIATDVAVRAAFTTPHTATGNELDDLAQCLANIAWVRPSEHLDAATGPRPPGATRACRRCSSISTPPTSSRAPGSPIRSATARSRPS